MAYQTIVAGGRKTSPGTIRSLVNALTTASTTSTHKQINLQRTYASFGFQCVLATTKANKAILEGSISGSTWIPIAGSTWSSSGGKANIKYVTGKPLAYVRAAWVTKSTAGSSGGINAYIAPGV